MMCMTELHGGVCHRTSTPHKSGNKMKEKNTPVVHLGFFPRFQLLRRVLIIGIGYPQNTNTLCFPMKPGVSLTLALSI